MGIPARIKAYGSIDHSWRRDQTARAPERPAARLARVPAGVAHQMLVPQGLPSVVAIGNVFTEHRQPLGASRIALRDDNLRDPAELLAQLERSGDPAQRLQGSARADDRDVAVVKDAAHQALVNVQTLHLVEVHLDRVARYESALHDNSPVGQDQFSGLSPDDRGQYHGEADHQRYRNHSKRRAGVVSGGDVSAQRSQQEAVSYTHLRAHETRHDLVCRLLLEKK